MDISETRQRSSAQLLDQVAHEAKLVKKDEHISGSPSAPTGDEVYRHAADPKLPVSPGADLRLSYDNDAANLGLAKALYGSKFAATEAQLDHRTGVAQGAIDKVAAHVTGNARVVLQSRADEGFIAAEVARKANPRMSGPEQAAAIADYMQTYHGDQMKNDPAFAAGVKRNLSLHSSGDDAGVNQELHDIGQRSPVHNTCVGTFAG